MKIVICGFSGSGKSHLLREVEQSSLVKDIRFLDLDEEICKNYGIAPGALGEQIRVRGWQWFREAESSALAKLLKIDCFILALGGGALSEGNLGVIRSNGEVKICWLDESFEKCYKNIALDSNRPLNAVGKENLEEIYLERCSYYARADIKKNYSQLKDYLQQCIAAGTICHSDDA